MISLRLARACLVTCSLLLQSVNAETLIAAGNLRAANTALKKITADAVDQSVRAGTSPAAAIRQLSLVFTSKEDQEYLRSLVTGPEADKVIKFRAIEKLAAGYRVTSPNGRVAKFGFNAKTHRATVNGHELPAVAEGAKAFISALDKELGSTKFAHLNLLSLFGSESAAAFLATVPIGLLVIGGFLIACGILSASGEVYSTVKKGSVAEYLDRLTKLCEMERTSSRANFDDSETGRVFKLMVKQNVLDANTTVPAGDCTAMVDRIFVNNSKMETANRKLTRGEVSEACLNAAGYSACVKDYQKRDATVGVAPTPAPAPTGTGVGR